MFIDEPGIDLLGKREEFNSPQVLNFGSSF